MIQRILIAIVILTLSTNATFAQDSSWQVKNFNSEITINQDTSISVKEEISVDFGYLQKHGIFRDIPYLHSTNGRSLKTEIKNISITDENNDPYQFTQERHAQSLQLKIGDADTYITGENIYLISYTVENAIQSFDDLPELYWNVTGSEWEVPILQATATITSSHAEITDIDCFYGTKGSTSNCSSNQEDDRAIFKTVRPLSSGDDFTIAVQLNPTNSLTFPSMAEQAIDTFLSNIGYPIALLPLLIISVLWWKHGRDRSYISEIYYYKPDDKSQRPAPVFPRLSLPLTYSPINGLSPSEAGTLMDEHVHIQDIISEIVELARLGYIKIHKIGKKKLFKQQEYELEKLKDEDEKLEPHQQLILKEIFDKNSKTKKVSELANKFYTSLPKIKESIYKQLIVKDMFNSNPEKTKAKWVAIYVVLSLMAGYVVFYTSIIYFNFVPILFQIIVFPIGFIFALSMPRRTAWGYSLFQQTKALREYIKVGKWRHDIAEKHLFLDEMLPLAISLGVVKELAKDMDKLNIKPPSYTQGMLVGSFASDFSSFNSSLTNNITSSPQGSSSGGFSTSGRSSWSGGSGFSGGSSGGGFGGGGGGSW